MKPVLVTKLADGDGTILLTVCDEGTGLAAGLAPGSGIRGMRERAALIGAELELHSRKDAPGTEVRLQVPVEVHV